jgi:hypothetical protein
MSAFLELPSIPRKAGLSIHTQKKSLDKNLFLQEYQNLLLQILFQHGASAKIERFDHVFSPLSIFFLAWASGRPSTVHSQGLGADEAGVFRGEEHDCVGHLLHPPGPPQGVGLLTALHVGFASLEV